MGAFVDDAAGADHLAELLKALANPARLRIVAALCEGHTCVSALAERLAMGQAIVSQQLRILRMEGLVEAEREGGFSHYCLAEPQLKELVKCLEKCPRA